LVLVTFLRKSCLSPWPAVVVAVLVLRYLAAVAVVVAEQVAT
jgi:hypothetical protein